MASIEKRSKNTYRVTVSTGYDANGKKQFKKKTFTLDEGMTDKQKEKELTRLSVLFEKEVESGTFLDGEKITFSEFTERWLVDYAEKQLAPKTFYRYKLLLERIIPALGHIKLAKLQPQHLLEFYNNLSEDGIRTDNRYKLKNNQIKIIKETKKEVTERSTINARTLTQLLSGGITDYKTANKLSTALNQPIEKIFDVVGKKKGLSGRTILHHHRLLSSMLTIAVQWQLITSNPCERVKPPKAEEKEAAHYEDYQVAEMFALLDKEPLKYQCAIYIALYGGLRLGEITALDWQDVNFDKGTLIISKSRQYIKEMGSFEKEPKTKSSKRVIDLSDSVLRILKLYKHEQTEECLKLGELWQDSGKIFTQWNGAPMFPSTPSFWFGKWVAKTGLPKISFHQLRHTNASLLISEGVDIVTVSKRLGHSKTSTTTDIYSHAIAKRNKEAADKLENLFNNRLQSVRNNA